MGEDLRVCVRLVDRLWIIRPAGQHGGVALLFKHGGPALPATRQKPESMNKEHWSAAGGVCALNLGIESVAGGICGLNVRRSRHASLLCLQNLIFATPSERRAGRR